MKVTIEKQEYQVENHEFSKIYIEKYCNLEMYNELGEFERLIALITEICKEVNINKALYVNPTHGYTGKWEQIKVEYERETDTAQA